MTVSKSPVATYFPRRPSGNSLLSEVSGRSASRDASTPLDFAEMHDRLNPDSPGTTYRHIANTSTSSIDRMDPQSAMRRTVSSGISKRIQALTESSSREGSPSSTGRTLSTESPQEKLNRMDSRESRRSPPPIGARGSSFRNMHRYSARISAYQSQLAGPNAAPMNNNAVWSVQQDPVTNRDSVSVSARIVRPNAVQNEPAAEEEPPTDQLQQPELLINHKRATPSQTNVPALHPIDTNQLARSSDPNSLSPDASRSPTGIRQMHSVGRFGRQKPSVNVDDFPPPPSHAAAPAPSNEENAPAKETTRTSRFFKRMSNIGSKRKPQSIASSTSPASERGSLIAPVHPAPSKDKADMPPAITVGDLNIQFPDSLVSSKNIATDDRAY
jgi:hypothetical protein